MSLALLVGVGAYALLTLLAGGGPTRSALSQCFQSSSGRDGKHSPRHANMAKKAMVPTETFDRRHRLRQFGRQSESWPD
jgi:hypothetical protein